MSSEKKCCVPGCSGNSGSRTTLHLFPSPAKDMDRFLQWVFKIGGGILAYSNDYIYQHRRVCHAHFEPKYCCRNNRISNIAVPTLNMPGLSIMKFTTFERKPLNAIENVTEVLPSTSKVCTYLQNPDQEISVSTPPAQRGKENIESTNLRNINQDISVIIPAAPQKGKENFARQTVKKPIFLRAKMTKTEHKLYKKLLDVKMKLSKCRNITKKQGAELKTAKNLFANEKFRKALESMPSTGRLITLLQFRENKKKEQGRRFSEKEKIVCLSILKQSPKAYRFLRKMFVLPSPQTLGTLLNQANISPGINKKVFAQLKIKTQKMTVDDRLCVLLFDEMSLKPNLSFSTRKDKVTGFVTDGEETRPVFADHAQVYMIRGLIRSYKQPVAYTFSSGATAGPELAKQLKIVIKKLQDAGFIVLATVCDQGANNRSAIKILTDEMKRECLQSGEIPKTNHNVFRVNSQEIIPLYDPPHLLKGIRNNLLTKDLKFEINGQIKTAKWHHLELLMKENPAYKGIRLVPKLTENHVDHKKISKMKVKYAAQVFSQTVASNMGYLADKGILPEDCKDTADLLLFFDELFDSVNGSFANKRKFSKPLLQAVKPTSKHHKKWVEFKKILLSMKFYKGDVIENVPTLKNWVWTLEGIQTLLKKLHKEFNVSSVWMRHLNQDSLENFFGAIRSHGCRNVNPTPEAFQSAYAALLVNNLSSVHSPGANCEEDFCKALVSLVSREETKDKTTHELDMNKILNINVVPIEEKCNNLNIIAPLQYVSGYLINKSKRIFKNCHNCNKDLINKNETEYIRYREYSKKRWLCSPTQSVVELVSAFQDIITEELKENLESKNLGEYIKTLIYILVDFKCFKCNKHREKLQKFIIDLSIRFFLFNHCKTLNKIISGKQDTVDTTDKYQVMARNYYKKHCKRPFRQ